MIMMLLIRMMILMTLLLVWRKLVDCCKRRSGVFLAKYESSASYYHLPSETSVEKESSLERKYFPPKEEKATLENIFQVSSDWKHSNTFYMLYINFVGICQWLDWRLYDTQSNEPTPGEAHKLFDNSLNCAWIVPFLNCWLMADLNW